MERARAQARARTQWPGLLKIAHAKVRPDFKSPNPGLMINIGSVLNEGPGQLATTFGGSESPRLNV